MRAIGDEYAETVAMLAEHGHDCPLFFLSRRDFRISAAADDREIRSGVRPMALSRPRRGRIAS